MTQAKSQSSINGKKKRQEEFQENVQASYKRNLVTLILFESMWWMGFGIVIPAVFLPSYLNTLDASKTLIGIVASLYFLTMPLNFLVDKLPTRIPRKFQALMAYASLGLIYIVAGMLSMAFNSSAALIVIISLAMLVFFSICNVVVPLHFEIITDNIPQKRRGMVFSIRILFAGSAGLTSTLVVSKLLAGMGDELQVTHITLIVAGVIYTCASTVLLRLKDNPDPARKIRLKRNYKISFFKNNLLLIIKLWYRPNYRIMTFFTIILIASGLLGTFMITAAQDILHMDMEQLQDNLRPMFLGVLIVGALVVGPIADRWGYLTMLTAIAVLISLGNLLMLFPSKTFFYIAYNCNVCGMSFIAVAITNLCLEMLPKIRTSRLIAATNLFCLPVNFAIPWLFGQIIDTQKAAGLMSRGYNMTFISGLVLGLIAVAGFSLIVDEPRGGRELTYRFLRRV